jgi:hypothetical protein
MGKKNKPHYVAAFAHLESVQRHVDQTQVHASPTLATRITSPSMASQHTAQNIKTYKLYKIMAKILDLVLDINHSLGRKITPELPQQLVTKYLRQTISDTPIQSSGSRVIARKEPIPHE